MNSEAHTELQPTTREIYEAFDEEIVALGGTTTDLFDDGTRLFARAVLPMRDDVRPGDGLQNGVALRTSGTEILVHPYTFRLVCTNGAVRAQALETRRIQRPVLETLLVSAQSYDVATVLSEVGDAVRACAAPSAFARGVEEMRSAADTEADVVFDMLSLITRLPPSMHGRLLWRRLQWSLFQADSDRSLFALGNALTAEGRDEPDPEMRWRLEEAGAEVFACSAAIVGAPTREAVARRVMAALSRIGLPAVPDAQAIARGIDT